MKDPVRTLRIDGVKTALTPTPDDAELAAQALLESRIYGDKEQRRDGRRKKEDGRRKHQPSDISHQTSGVRDAQYYRELSDRIRATHEQDMHAATRYVAYVESCLSHQPLPKKEGESSAVEHQPSDFAELEHGLFKHQDTVEREGGELLKRWQKCLAECILRQMTSADDTNKHEDGIKTE